MIRGNTKGLCLAAALLAVAVTAPAQKSHKRQAASSPARPDALRAMFDVRSFSGAEISPDGKRVAWVENLPGPGGAPSSDTAIYVADVNAPEHPARISAGDGKVSHEEHDAVWSPDGKRIAFLSDAASHGQLQLFVVDSAGAKAKPKQLTHFKGFVSDPGWSPDGKQIAVLYTENATRAAGPLVAETPDEGVISENYLEQRLTLVDPSTSVVREISPADTYVYEYGWAPTSDRLVISSAKGNGDDNWWVASLSAIDAATGAMQTVLAKPETQIAVPRWSPDGKQIAFIGGLMSDEGVTGGDVFVVPAIGSSAQNVTPEMKESASSISWLPGSGAILFTAIADGETAINRLGLAGGGISRLWSGAERISPGHFSPSISVSSDGKISAAVRQSFAQPPEVWAGPIGNWRQITHNNAGLEAGWGKAVSLHWTTEIGTVQGWLVYPLNFDPAKKYPMVVAVHGGPASASMPGWPSRWSYFMTLPSRGYFVLFPNPRGSYGEGEKFTSANVKDFGGGDFLDIMAGVDQAIKSAPIDPNRLGITGWSYGGYMTMWAVTQTSRFRAAVSGAGLANWVSYYGENKIDQWMIPYFGASVYDDPGVYAKSAPINFIKNAKTPTLVVVGDRDGECPAPQSFEFWHALKTMGVPTEMVVYSSEGHMFVNPAHNRDVIQRTAAWFDTYLQMVP